MLSRLNVVRHFLFKAGARVSHQPETAQAVLYQVLHNPVGSEELGGGGNVLTLHDLPDHLIFLLADVELVEPTDDFDFLPIPLLDIANQMCNQRIGAQKVVRKQ
ncbi:hypothetical protein D9M70_508460 [compost metagenome]